MSYPKDIKNIEELMTLFDKYDNDSPCVIGTPRSCDADYYAYIDELENYKPEEKEFENNLGRRKLFI